MSDTARADWSRISIGLYGVRKVGKTTCAASARAPFIFDCEDRAKGMALPPEAKPYTPTLMAVERVIHAMETILLKDAYGRPRFPADFPYRTLILDGFDPIYHKTLEDVVNGVVIPIGRKFEADRNPAKTNILAAHQFAADLVARVLYRFLALPAVHVITMHERTTDGDVIKGRDGKPVWDRDKGAPARRRLTTPDLAPKILQLLEDRLDVLAYCYREVGSGARLMTTAETNTPERYISAFDSTGVIGFVPDSRSSRSPRLLPAPVVLDWDASIVGPLRRTVQSEVVVAPGPAHEEE